jgi:hypothetical protein
VLTGMAADIRSEVDRTLDEAASRTRDLGGPAGTRACAATVAANLRGAEDPMRRMRRRQKVRLPATPSYPVQEPAMAGSQTSWHLPRFAAWDVPNSWPRLRRAGRSAEAD